MASHSTPPACLPSVPLEAGEPVAIPAGAWDTHMHVIGGFDRYALMDGRGYTPHVRTVEDYRPVMDGLGLARAVLVQPSFYGFDNSAMLDTMRADPVRFRGVAVVPPDAADHTLHEMDRLGVRGIRINLRNPGGLALADITRLARRVEGMGWHIQLQVSLDALGNLDDLLDQTDLPFVLDHFGFVDVARGAEAPGFTGLLRAMARGRIWVKLSGPYRISRQEPGYTDLLPFVHALTGTRPDRLLWATDWPHTEMWRFMPQDRDLAALLPRWLPTQALLQQVLCHNPAALYDRA